jgi:hypothetical protein
MTRIEKFTNFAMENKDIDMKSFISGAKYADANPNDGYRSAVALFREFFQKHDIRSNEVSNLLYEVDRLIK